MDDSKNTVIVTGLGRNITKEDFTKHFKRVGDIMKSKIATERCEGSVTYVDSKTAEKAVDELNGEKLNGNKIKVEMADKFYSDHFDDTNNTELAGKGNGNKDWSISSAKTGGGGGKGGKGGVGGPGVPSGHDGEDGEPGPGGKGGRGGRPAVTNALGKRPYNEKVENERNNINGWTGGGKGGKGGVGGHGVPSGHDGEDGEPGPGGKGGAGGKPALSGPYQAKNPYQWNGNWNNDPWYTRWFGIGGANKKSTPKYNCSGGGKGGKGGVGWNNVPSGHDGEDGEAGPGGRGGAGGRPAC